MQLGPQWDRLLAQVADTIGRQEVEIWLRSSVPTRLDGNRLVVRVPNRWYGEWIVDNYLEAINRAAGPLFEVSDVDVVWPDDATSEVDAPPEVQESAPRVARAIGVNAAQTFENFVVGKCNEFAHAAASGVADRPAVDANPLFIYGGTGLGKTHLMHAIANRILATHTDARVVYVTAEDFMNELINSIKNGRPGDFRAKYRERASVLLVDDIQFLTGKERTQDEFFFTFEALRTSGRQVILTSDVEPRFIKGLEPRLRTRFEGGLIADMQAPERETLLAILHKKADERGLRIPSDLADQICSSVQGNIREVEGLLNRLTALQNFHQTPVTLELAQRYLQAVFHPATPQVTVAAIIDAVARYHNLRSADLMGARKARQMSGPRQIAMYLARELTHLSYPELGKEFGGRDHSTIQHGCKKIEKDIVGSPDLAYKIKLIEQSLLRR